MVEYMEQKGANHTIIEMLPKVQFSCNVCGFSSIPYFACDQEGNTSLITNSLAFMAHKRYALNCTAGLSSNIAR